MRKINKTERRTVNIATAAIREAHFSGKYQIFAATFSVETVVFVGNRAHRCTINNKIHINAAVVKANILLPSA